MLSGEYDKIIKQYKSAVYGTLYAYLKFNSDIDDLTQDTFIYAYYNFDKLRDKEKIGAWLCGIARNKALKFLRQTRYHITLDEITEIHSDIDVDDIVIRNERNTLIFDTIQSLSKPIAETISLYYFADMSINEIAQSLAVSEGTIKSRLHDGRKKLKGELIGMIENEHEKQNVDTGELINRVNSYIDNATSASKTHDFPSVIRNCNEVISLLENTKSEYKTLAKVYRMKAMANLQDRSQRIADGEKSVKYAELSGDKRFICDCMLSLAFDKGVDTFREVYGIAREINYYEICCEAACWIGTNCINQGNIGEAETWFDIALYVYEKTNRDSTVNACDGDVIRIRALANAALKSIELLKNEERLPSNFSTLNTLAQIIHIDGDEIKSGNCYGWDIPGGQFNNGKYRLLFGIFECRDVIYNKAWSTEDHTVSEYYDYDGVLIQKDYYVISRSETITVKAGTFNNCTHIRVTESVSDDGQSEGEFWFTPEMVEVKGIVRYPNSPKHDGITELAEVKNGRYEYEHFTGNGEPYSDIHYKDYYEIDLTSDDLIILSNYGYSYI